MKNILLLEDDLSLAMHYREGLEDAGYAVYHDVNVDAAKVTLEAVDVHVVITDIMLRSVKGMPSSTGGLSLLSHITLNVRPIPHLVVITGTDSQLQLLKMAETFNVAVSLEKPFAVESLIDEVNVLARIPKAKSLLEIKTGFDEPDGTLTPPL